MKSICKILLSTLFLFLTLESFATHNRAGEITYTHVSGFTYEFTITTYTKISGVSADADRTRLGISWGDGTFDSLDRVSEVLLSADIKQNKYVGIHTYSGPFTYVVGVQDPNRIDNIININNAVNTPFYIEDTVKILDPNIIGYNNSPQLLNPPIEYGNVGQVFTHNPNAYDPDGDSLSYSISTPLQALGTPVNGYSPPNLIMPGPNNQLSINQHTGELVWNTPQVAGIYNIVILIKEYRNGIFIGSVIRDLQIIIDATNNHAPDLQVTTQICAVIGDSIVFTANATDIDIQDKITLSANGAPFIVSNSPATFTVGAPANPISGTFRWQTTCDHLLKNDYFVVFNAVDNFNGPPLTDQKTLTIKLLAPPPANLISTLNITNKTVTLKWDSLYVCAGNAKFQGFSIWRKQGCGTALDSCSTALEDLGYVKIGETSNYSFVDNTLQTGNQYSYRVVAEFGDKSNASIVLNRFKGLASTEACVTIPADIPVIYNVDVKTTDAANGKIYVEWSRPFADKLDTLINHGPYQFLLYRAIGINGNNFTLVKTVNAATFSAITDTTFLDSTLNTIENAYTYKLVFLVRGTDTLGSTSSASSIFLNVAAQFEALQLSWSVSVPWSNSAYTIFRKLPGSSTFDSLTTVTTLNYLDENLMNDSLYCYKIRSTGSYSIAGLKTPLINYSQEVCARPKDTVVACTPTLSVNNFCTDSRLDTSEYKNFLSWTFDNTSNCVTNDIEKIRIFYAKNSSDTLKQIDSLVNVPFNVYTHILADRNLTACYAIQAVRSNGNASLLSNKVCVDNCPLYELPNAFTPNGDGQNDLYTPIIPYRLVERIDMKIYNRWGNLVFETTNPNINWNGTDYKTGKALYTGVYYYVCDVYFLSASGEQKLAEPLSGYIHLFRE
ncbi:MAG: gliding motility-associated C-terminal domain-containing protein [Chitinophagales bacterium]